MHVADFPNAVAVIVTLPACLPVILPLESTVAIFVSEDFHVTVPSQFKVAFRVVVLPHATLAVFLSSLMLTDVMIFVFRSYH